MAGQNYARLRRETKFDVLELAVSLRRQVARYVMNEKRVSKKWRYFDGLPAVNYARTIRDYISYANDIRLDDPERAEERILLDFKGYFGNLDHGIAKQMIRDHFDDDGILWLADRFIDSYYEHFCREAEKKGLPPPERKGLGLGSEVNQTIAIAYPDRIDHYIKEALRIKCYVRYMDDLVLVHESRDYLQHCLAEIERLCGELKIAVNHNKTYIVKLSTGFEFLKKRFSVTETGKILRKPSRSAVTRTRRVIKRHKGLVDRGIISYEDARASYLSRRASLGKTIYNLDKLFMKLHEKEAI